MSMKLLHMLLCCVSVFGMNSGTLYKLYTIEDYRIRAIYAYAKLDFTHEVQCVFKCVIDTRCNSVAYQPVKGKCVLFERFTTASDTQLTRNRLEQRNGWKSISKLVDKGQDKLCMDTGYPEGEKCFKFSSEKATNSNGQQFCSDHGGKLAEISTSYENDLMKGVLSQFEGTNSWWFGLTDKDVEGQWVWLSSGHAPNFTDWADGEPDDGIGSNCSALTYAHDYTWVDEPCTNSYTSICEL